MRLKKNERDAVWAGVCAGIADYIAEITSLKNYRDLIMVGLRLLFCAAVTIGFAGFWAYLALILIIPDDV